MSEVAVYVREATGPDDRSLLADAISETSGCDSSAVEIEYRCLRCGSVGHGKPHVVEPAGYFVSLSRSAGLVAVAVTDGAPVGIDITRIDAVARADVSAVLRHSDDDAVTPIEIARSWAAKEAVLKATGWGLHIDPSELAVVGGQLVLWPAQLELDEAPEVDHFEVGDEVVGAVAFVVVGD